MYGAYQRKLWRSLNPLPSYGNVNDGAPIKSEVDGLIAVFEHTEAACADHPPPAMLRDGDK